MGKIKYTKEILEKAISESRSFMETLRKLGLNDRSGSNFYQIKLKIKAYQINTSHFTGQGWCTGEYHKKLVKSFVEIPLNEILIKNSVYLSTSGLKKRLLKENLLKNECYNCKLKPFWNNETLTLQLDHIDGDRTNNTLENLRILCPNCHSQTKTFAGRGILVKSTRSKLIKSKKESESEKELFSINKCQICDKKVWRKNSKCKSCALKSRNKNKINWPSNEELIEMTKNRSFLSVAKELGVSDNAIRKRLKNYCGIIIRKHEKTEILVESKNNLIEIEKSK